MDTKKLPESEPTTEEALPNVDLRTHAKTEEISRETLGPDAVEPDVGDDSDHTPHSNEK